MESENIKNEENSKKEITFNRLFPIEAELESITNDISNLCPSTVVFILICRSKEEKEALKQEIFEYIEFLHSKIEEERSLSISSHESKEINEMQEKVSTLNLRLKLIDKCEEFSLHRLNHLEEIFKYYCTHIFKIGKHMTFDRLEYEREHLNTERFFLFLKDFGLTLTEIEGKQKEIVSKQAVMTIFKKISSNSRDLTFEEFIKCLEKIAVVYYDEKAGYWTKIEEENQERIRRKKQIERRKLKRMKMNGQKVDEKVDNNDENSGSEKEENNKKESQESRSKSEKTEQNHENDDLIKQMMEDENLEDPNEEINRIANQKKQEAFEIEKEKKDRKDNEKRLLSLTNNEKIEYFYQMIGVDSVKEYKNKLTILNMPLFHKEKKEGSSRNESRPRQTKTINLEDQGNNQLEASKSYEEEERQQKLKEKMNEKKEKLKNLPIPKPKEVKESETAKKRKEMKIERELRMIEKQKEKHEEIEKLKQKGKDAKREATGKTENGQENSPPIQRQSFNEKEVNWSMLEKMTFDQLKLRQFNPQKLYNQDEDDHIFLQEYGDFKLPHKSRTSRIQARERQSLSIVENMKKRADEVEKSERNEETKLEKKTLLTARGSVKGKL